MRFKPFTLLTLTLLLFCSIAYGQIRPEIKEDLNVSPTSISFSSEGGSKTIDVTSIGTWRVDNVSASWINAVKNGNKQFTVRAERNTNTSSRNATIKIVSGNKSATIRVTQSGGSARTEDTSNNSNNNRTTEQSYFSISSSRADFPASGGSKTFTVSSSSTWHIDTGTNGWGSLSKSGNKLTLTVGANPNASSRSDYFILRSGTRTLRVDFSQSGEATLSVSQENLNFESSGGAKTISITSNGSWSISTDPASWGHISRSGNQLTLTVDANSSTSSRSDYFVIKAGSKTQRVRISQAGSAPTLSVSNNNLSFGSSSSSTTIYVTSNTQWSISTNPASWGHITINGNQLKFTVDGNYSSSPRNDYFIISAGNKSQQVNITQAGRTQQNTYSNSSYSSTSSYRRYRRPFNHSWDNFVGGFSVGYIQKQWTSKYDDNSTEEYGLFDDDKYYNGIQAGFRIDPQFGAGFGMNSGLFYEYCWGKSDKIYDEAGSFHITYEEHGLYLPLDLKFTMNFSRWFQLSFYGGVGLNYVLSGKAYARDGGKTWGTTDTFKEEDNWSRFNAMLEYGASLRINAIQFDVTMAKGLNDWSDTKGTKITQGRPLCVSATICF